VKRFERDVSRGRDTAKDDLFHRGSLNDFFLRVLFNFLAFEAKYSFK
jgi:hypothetical protein